MNTTKIELRHISDLQVRSQVLLSQVTEAQAAGEDDVVIVVATSDKQWDAFKEQRREYEGTFLGHPHNLSAPNWPTDGKDWVAFLPHSMRRIGEYYSHHRVFDREHGYGHLNRVVLIPTDRLIEVRVAGSLTEVNDGKDR